MVSNLPTVEADKKAQIDHAVPFLLRQCCLYTNRRAALDASNAANQQTGAPSGTTAVVHIVFKEEAYATTGRRC
jgi:hypothetical protein